MSIVEKLIICATPICLLCVFFSESVVSVLLGPKWPAAAPILSILAINGLTQPLVNSAGWLFISQDRTKDLLKWGLISAPVIVASFVVGLPFGPQGVAISYTCTFAVITPMLLAYVARKGPVKLGQFAYLGKVALQYAACNATGLFICSRLTANQTDWFQLVTATILAGALTFGLLLSSAHGRKTIQEFGMALSLAMRSRQSTTS